jgi:hypothetical protein
MRSQDRSIVSYGLCDKTHISHSIEIMAQEQIFLLSPANCRGNRTELILRKDAAFDLAVRLREQGASIGEVFSFLSGLYFRGKLAYARQFAVPPKSMPGTWIITAGRGLLRSDENIRVADIRAFSRIAIDLAEPLYRDPLLRDALELANSLSSGGQVVLLGSIATDKYVAPLHSVFGTRLVYPREFVGRGDMSRGGLMLRCCDEECELTYVPVGQTLRRGTRPKKLPKRTRPEPS